MNRVVSEGIPPLDGEGGRIPDAFVAIVARACAVDRTLRYATAAEMARAIEALGHGVVASHTEVARFGEEVAGVELSLRRRRVSSAIDRAWARAGDRGHTFKIRASVIDAALATLSESEPFPGSGRPRTLSAQEHSSQRESPLDMAAQPFTKNYSDHSNDTGFQFEFFCDKCGSGHRSAFQTNSLGVAAQLLKAAGALFGGGAYRAGWGADHVKDAFRGPAWDGAFKKAVEESRPKFRQCTKCGKWVCPEVCWNHARGQCEGCAPDLREHAVAAQAQVAVEQTWESARKADQMRGLDVQGAALTAAMQCPGCQSSLAEGARFCPGCGTAVALAKAGPRFCSGCGNQLQAGARFCQNCGSGVG